MHTDMTPRLAGCLTIHDPNLVIHVLPASTLDKTQRLWTGVPCRHRIGRVSVASSAQHLDFYSYHLVELKDCDVLCRESQVGQIRKCRKVTLIRTLR